MGACELPDMTRSFAHICSVFRVFDCIVHRTGMCLPCIGSMIPVVRMVVFRQSYSTRNFSAIRFFRGIALPQCPPWGQKYESGLWRLSDVQRCFRDITGCEPREYLGRPFSQSPHYDPFSFYFFI
jgi:hypothetical protein